MPHLYAIFLTPYTTATNKSVGKESKCKGWLLNFFQDITFTYKQKGNTIDCSPQNNTKRRKQRKLRYDPRSLAVRHLDEFLVRMRRRNALAIKYDRLSVQK